MTVVRDGLRVVAFALAVTFVGSGCSSTRSQTAVDAGPLDDAGDVFDCGGTTTCDASFQICQHVSGGAPPGVNVYSCTEIPTECAGQLSCVCVTTALQNRGAGGCSATGNQITVQINVP
jgi:hypothetical protein